MSGRITHLEVFNLKDYLTKDNNDYQRIRELQHIINEQNVIKLKRFIVQVITELEREEAVSKRVTIEKLNTYLFKLEELLEYYSITPLETQMGSDSVGRAWMFSGMGLAILDTLPEKTQKSIKKSGIKVLPIAADVIMRKTVRPITGVTPVYEKMFSILRKIPIVKSLMYRSKSEWIIENDVATSLERSPNIISIGGYGVPQDEYAILPDTHYDEVLAGRKHPWRYMNTTLKNWLKVIIGFIPAFLTFSLTKEWWLLQYGGAFIWFGITGLRNVVQSVFGGRGIRHSNLLKWNDYISWGRIADSLLFTGFSVPLLDYLIKTLLLHKGMNITTTTSPMLLYTIMALVNGVYLTTHNLFRGLPKAAAFGNFFRSVLSIPVAILFNFIVYSCIGAFGLPPVRIDDILQKWAAVISKTASDCVAGIIEGSADRFKSIKIRRIGYKNKIKQVFSTYSRLELIFPQKSIRQMLDTPEEFLELLDEMHHDVSNIMIINSIDLLYFWMYQPQSRNAFTRMAKKMTPDEREIILKSLQVLRCEKEITTLFAGGFMGRRFSKSLAFYLENHKQFLKDSERILG
jgi:hypothetical protein